MNLTNNIPVTRPFLDIKSDFMANIQRVLFSQHLTNYGNLYIELKKVLSERAKTHHCYVSNGTISLQLLLKLLGSNGEIITTPFSYVATTNAILWEETTGTYRVAELRILALQIEACDLCRNGSFVPIATKA